MSKAEHFLQLYLRESGRQLDGFASGVLYFSLMLYLFQFEMILIRVVGAHLRVRPELAAVAYADRHTGLSLQSHF